MNILILETSTEKGLLTFASDGEPLASISLSGGPELSRRLALETDLLLKKVLLKPAFLAVGQGPGSYTGIRVGAALAKALSFAWKIPLIGFCSLKAFTPPSQGPFAILFDARMGGLYTLLGTREGTQTHFEEPFLLPLSQAKERLGSIPTFASPHPLQEKTALSGTWFETAPDPVFLAQLVTPLCLFKGTTHLIINYLNKS